MYPPPSDNECSQHYLTIDPDRPLDESLSPIPYLPAPEEIVQLQDKSLIYVVSVASRTYTITGHKLVISPSGCTHSCRKSRGTILGCFVHIS